MTKSTSLSGSFDVSLALQRGDPAVHLGERRAGEGVLLVNPGGLRESEEEIVSARIRAVCTGGA